MSAAPLAAQRPQQRRSPLHGVLAPGQVCEHSNDLVQRTLLRREMYTIKPVWDAKSRDVKAGQLCQ
jgi:hypothetical protein